MTTQQEFVEQALAISREAGVLDTLHRYFVQQADRLYQASAMFGLLDRQLGDVLEVGPFFGYTPFLLRPNATSYTVLEGDDPVVYPLKPIYERHRIKADLIDLFEWFGPTRTATHSLGFPDNSFDTVLCWETMEHFNFNPVKFVRELHRVLKPGGRAYITVPNMVSFQRLVGYLFGRAEQHLVQGYFQYEDYISNGKKAFFGFHWREYSRPELALLFATVGFKVIRSDTFVAFQTHAKTSPAQAAARGAARILAGVFRRYGTHVLLEAGKPEHPH